METVLRHIGGICRTQMLSWSYCPVVISRSDNIRQGVNIPASRTWGGDCAPRKHLSLVQNPVLRSDKETCGLIEVVSGDHELVSAVADGGLVGQREGCNPYPVVLPDCDCKVQHLHDELGACWEAHVWRCATAWVRVGSRCSCEVFHYVYELLGTRRYNRNRISCSCLCLLGQR